MKLNKTQIGFRLHMSLFVCVLIALTMVLYYIFVLNHKVYITPDNHWYHIYNSHNNAIIINNISHDEDTWYYKNKSTCVNYSGENESCPRHEGYCAGNKSYGSPEQQVKAVIEAIMNGGEHKECPLIY